MNNLGTIMNTTAAEVLERELRDVNFRIKRLAMQIAGYAEDINKVSKDLAALTERADELRQALRPNTQGEHHAKD